MGKGRSDLSAAIAALPKSCRISYKHRYSINPVKLFTKFSKIWIYLIVSSQLNSSYYTVDVNFAKLSDSFICNAAFNY